MQFINPDILIVGAGPVGCVLAERSAKLKNWNSLIIEKRNHIAGNCFDLKNNRGLLYHKYGPHYMRFKKKRIFNFLSNFTKWIDGNYVVKSYIGGELYPIPINLITLEKFFNKKFKSKKKAVAFINKKKYKIKNPKNSEEFILSKLGREIYESFYKNYTLKQWGIHPKKLSKKICCRLPIRFNRNCYYVNEKMKFIPKDGYTKMFSNMIKNKRIKVMLNTDFKKIRSKIKPKIATIYTGTPDSYFNNIYGKLDWRSLKFVFKTFKRNKFQECVQINYPNEKKYTRRVEIKHVTKQKSKFTILSYEYPKSKGDPYYPIDNNKNNKLFSKYKKLINKEERKNIFFEGRLAQYKYLNMDEAIERALILFDKIKKLKK